jgi:hypothetical protein
VIHDELAIRIEVDSRLVGEESNQQLSLANLAAAIKGDELRLLHLPPTLQEIELARAVKE